MGRIPIQMRIAGDGNEDSRVSAFRTGRYNFEVVYTAVLMHVCTGFLSAHLGCNCLSRNHLRTIIAKSAMHGYASTCMSKAMGQRSIAVPQETIDLARKASAEEAMIQMFPIVDKSLLHGAVA
jgi:hypothetical protein